jgi:diguanylate cyclase (GGDEF)-like protein/PAS domain S-box-containing protein
MKSKTKTISENRKSAKAAIPKKSLLSLKDKTKKNKTVLKDSATLKKLATKLPNSESAEKYRTILENIEDGYFEVDLAGNLTFFNDSVCRVLGYPREELMGMNNRQYMDKEDIKIVFQTYNKVYTTGEPVNQFGWRIIRKDGAKRYIEGSIFLQKDSSGKPMGFGGIVRDITERKKIEEKLHRKEHLFRALADQSSDIIVLINREGIITYENPAVENILGFKAEERIGTSIFDHLHPDDFKLITDASDTLFGETTATVQKSEIRLHHRDGSWRTFEATGSNLVYDNVVQAVIVNLRDITERKNAESQREAMFEALRQSEKRYWELSIIDDLTQLYNSRHFYDQLKKETERSNRHEQPLTLLLLDLDKFKDFNDTYGHVEGDYVLSRLGQVIKRCLREIDSAYRYGGDEFTILLPMTTSEEGLVTAERIRMELKKEDFSPLSSQKVYLTLSIGLAQYKPQEEVKMFIHRADQMMYKGKKNGRDRICSDDGSVL